MKSKQTRKYKLHFRNLNKDWGFTLSLSIMKVGNYIVKQIKAITYHLSILRISGWQCSRGCRFFSSREPHWKSHPDRIPSAALFVTKDVDSLSLLTLVFTHSYQSCQSSKDFSCQKLPPTPPPPPPTWEWQFAISLIKLNKLLTIYRLALNLETQRFEENPASLANCDQN